MRQQFRRNPVLSRLFKCIGYADQLRLLVGTGKERNAYRQTEHITCRYRNVGITRRWRQGKNCHLQNDRH